MTTSPRPHAAYHGGAVMGGRTMTRKVASTEVMTSRILGLDMAAPLKDKESTSGTMRSFEPDLMDTTPPAPSLTPASPREPWVCNASHFERSRW